MKPIEAQAITVNSSLEVKTTSHSKESFLATFNEKGYYLLPGILSPERVLEIRKFLEEKFNEKFQDEDLIRDDTIPDHLCLYPELIDTFINDQLLEVIKSLVGDDFVLLSVSCIRNSFKVLHTDLTTAEGVGVHFFLRPDFNAITIGIYLQDCKDEGGGLFVVPGSHKKRDPLVKQRQLAKGIGVPVLAKIMRKMTGGRFPKYEDYSIFEKGGINLPTKAGDAVVFDMRILHRGSKAIAKRETTKFALFYHISASGQSCDEHIEFLLSEHGHPYLREPRNPEIVKKAAQNAGFTAI
jgi:hypothetical protein